MINVVRYRAVCAIFSACLVALFIGLAIYNYQKRGEVFSYSVDFTGGTQVLFKFDKPTTSASVRDVLATNGWQNAVTREFSSQEVLVRVKEYKTDSRGLAENMKQKLGESLQTSVEILQSETVGAGIGGALRWKSVRVVLFALILMLLYIASTFWSFAFAVGAVVALFHDAFVMLLTYLLFDREISNTAITAILTVLGYSINDTIIIFARIRENLGLMPGASMGDIVNASVNQTLRRTLLTSFTTGMPVVVMLLIGGEALFDLSLGLLVGIVFGTYSSIYIASPIMMLLYRK